MSCIDLAATTHHIDAAAKALLKQNEKNRNRIEMNQRL